MAPAVLAAVPLRGRLVTGDALYCQTALCRQIRRQDGDYLVIVKANQPELVWALTTLFTLPPPGERFATAVSWDQHGDRVETRRLWASTALAEYLDWPGGQQVLRVERTCRQRGKTTRQVRYAITSLGPEITPTVLRRAARIWGADPERTWLASSPSVTSRTQCSRFSIPQCARTARSICLALPVKLLMK